MKINNFINHLNKIAVLSGVVLINAATSVWAQPEPALRAVVSANAAPAPMSRLFDKLGAGDSRISVPGATWLQLQFAEVNLGPQGVLTITDSTGETQTFSQAEINAWGGLSAVFNGSELTVNLTSDQDAADVVSANIKDIIIGLPASTVGGAEGVAPQNLQNLLGPDIKRFIPNDSLKNLAPREGGSIETICGTTDDRVASANPRVGRIMPIGCTGWLIDGGSFLTAGHCIGAGTQTVEFNVPTSRADGTTVAPPVSDQYRVISQSIVSQNGGIGNDWAVFRVMPNTQTGLMPTSAQGATFQVSNVSNPAQVRITGYGVDGPAPNFGAGSSPRNSDNQTLQTHTGALSQNTGGATSGILRYDADTQGGNSGSPVITAGTNTTIGIHTNGGCTSSGGTNSGTSFRNAALWGAVNARTDDIIWQNVNGIVHYWPIQNGNRQDGFDIGAAGAVGPEWRLIGSGDLNGDRTDDIIWQHANGTVHYWPILNGQRQGGFNIGGIGPVGSDWRLIGAGDLNGDGTDDIIWQHVNGTVHYWPIRNGQRLDGLNIGGTGAVGADWKLIGAGDLNGDGTDDIIWQHVNGTVHYWPILNGNRQGGFNIGGVGAVGSDWKLIGAGDLNGDRTDDIIWQHVNGTVHYWPILNGNRQGGFDIGGVGAVGSDWRLIGAGDINGQ
ncbi:MAG: FG-GAP-like repeat-containing protein [Pseudomonadota bacterium]